MKKYIIIDAEAIEKRIEELESKIIPNPNFDSQIDSHNLLFIAKQNELNKILTQSTPFIPEIERAWEDGRNGTKISANFPFVYNKYVNKTSKEYISNLKLDI